MLNVARDEMAVGAGGKDGYDSPGVFFRVTSRGSLPQRVENAHFAVVAQLDRAAVS